MVAGGVPKGRGGPRKERGTPRVFIDLVELPASPDSTPVRMAALLVTRPRRVRTPQRPSILRNGEVDSEEGSKADLQMQRPARVRREPHTCGMLPVTPVSRLASSQAGQSRGGGGVLKRRPAGQEEWTFEAWIEAAGAPLPLFQEATVVDSIGCA